MTKARHDKSAVTTPGLSLPHELGHRGRRGLVLFLLLGAWAGPAQVVATPSSAEDSSTPTSEQVAPSLEGFNDPSGYYNIQVPTGYRITDKTSGNRSKRGFDYGPDLSLWILAHPMNKSWDPAGEMAKKADAINRGQAGFSAAAQVVKQQLIELGGTTGYELEIRSVSSLPLSAHVIALVGQGNAFSIAATCTDLRQEALYQQIVAAIKRSFQATQQTVPSPRAVEPTSAKPQPTRPESVLAPSLTINGVLKRGGNRLALINNNIYGEGDVVTVREGSRELRFRVNKIGDNNNQVELEPLNEP